jgi:hypothetical protein
MSNSTILSKIGHRLANAVLKSTGGASLYAAPGHFYSPIGDPMEAVRYVSDVAPDDGPPHVDPLTVSATFDRLSRHFSKSQAFLRGGRYRYGETNHYFNLGEAYIYSAFIAELNPQLIIEVGTGYSSACALDTVEQLGLATELVFVDPNPERLLQLISPEDHKRVNIVQSGVQEVSLLLFDRLGACDVLFLDTTHVCKTGSDVAHELFKILPRLRPGVIIHFHDIFDCWEYPERWIAENRSWNEIYALRAFLMFNQAFEVIYFNDFMWQRQKEQIDRTVLGEAADGGSGLYLRKL